MTVSAGLDNIAYCDFYVEGSNDQTRGSVFESTLASVQPGVLFFFVPYARSILYSRHLYTQPLYRNYLILLSPLFLSTVSKPIRSEPRKHPPVE